jgi:hypothetical protein
MNTCSLRKRKFIPFVVSLMELLAIRLSGKAAKSLVMSNHDRNKSITLKETANPSTSSGRTVDLIHASLMFLLLTLSGLAPTAQAGELGRLFFTPQQRQQMEFQGTSTRSAEDGRRNYIIVNGVVQKHGGNRTVWINGTAQATEPGNDRTPSTVPVTVPGKSQPVQLKVGQKLLLEAPAPEEDK